MTEPTPTDPGRDPEYETEVAPPLILASSRDGRGDPGVDVISNRSAAWRGISTRAQAAGWTATITYAMAWRADRMFSTGRVAKAAHLVHTVALRLVRAGVTAFAVWSAESKSPEPPGTGWSFSVAGLGWTATKDKAAWTKAVTIKLVEGSA